jgi:nitroimidazol reductase NimA-like FMN-containing flavoprotein (pyridoxamine 5'-phosphate oxidase superfamily)
MAVNREHELSREQCLELLADEYVGRLAVIVGGRPEVFPVNYVLDGDAIVFRTNPGTKLAGTTQGEVAFEVDQLHHPTRSGWSVVVHGVAQEVTGLDRPDLLERLIALPLGVWAGGDRPHLVRIAPREMTGRRVGPDPAD